MSIGAFKASALRKNRQKDRIVQVANPYPTAQHRPFETERPDAPIKFQSGFVRHRDRQCRQCLEPVRVARDRLCYGVIDASRNIAT
jgi:hypothetical protein